MNQKRKPAYVLYFQDKRYCNRIERLKPGEEVNVLVTADNNLDVDPVKAKGKRSKDGSFFTISVPNEKPYDWKWEILLASIGMEHPE